jgi:hypothetical protein
MKKVLIIAVLFFLSIGSNAQVEVSLGAKLGMNMSNISNAYDASGKTGFNSGAFVNLHLSRFYELQIETSYSEQGATLKPIPNASFGVEEKDIDSKYVSLGVSNKFYPFKDIGFNLLIGPAFEVHVVNSHGDISPIDLTFFGGLGYEFSFGLGIEVRYKKGIVDVSGNSSVFREYQEDYYDSPSMLNGVVQLGVSYRFTFGK